MNPTGTKREIRQHMLAMLRAVPMQQRDADSTLLRQQLSPYLNGSKQLTVGIYMPMPHEVDLLPLLREYPQHKYAVPRCLPGRQLCFHRISDAEKDTETGTHGIPAPKQQLPLVAPQELDILIVPGVAFTPQGDRLGYGGGYYDRYLPQCPQAQKIAVAFSQQMLAHLPTETHDLTIERIIHL